MRYKIWRVGTWGAITTSALLFLHKIVNAASLPPMPGIVYMGPPNQRFPSHGGVSTSTPFVPYTPDVVTPWTEYVLPTALGLIIIIVFIHFSMFIT